MLTRWMPLNTLSRFRSDPTFDTLDRFFEDFFDLSSNVALRMPYELIDDSIVLHADMPGVKREDVSVEYDSGMLTVSAKRDSRGSKTNYSRSVRVDDTLYDVNTIDAKLEDGVLSITIKEHPEKQKRSLKIAVN